MGGEWVKLVRLEHRAPLKSCPPDTHFHHLRAHSFVLSKQTYPRPSRLQYTPLYLFLTGTVLQTVCCFEEESGSCEGGN